MGYENSVASQAVLQSHQQQQQQQQQYIAQ